MTTYFVTRHKGAIEWALNRGIAAQHLPHLDPANIRKGDTVLGTLPVWVAAEICAKGARYFHLDLTVPANARGQEISALDMENYGAVLVEYSVKKVEG